MPFATPSPSIASSAQIAPGAVLGSDIANDTVLDANIGAHTTTKITMGAGSITNAMHAAGTQGGVKYSGSAGAFSELAAGTSGNFLMTQGAGSDPIWSPALPTFKTGIFTRAANASSNTQNIAHGLGKVPKFCKFTVMWGPGAQTPIQSHGCYDGTTTSCVYMIDMATNGLAGSSSTYVIFVPGDNTAPAGQKATVTFDSTNLILVWTYTATNGSVVMNVMWEAVG